MLKRDINEDPMLRTEKKDNLFSVKMQCAMGKLKDSFHDDKPTLFLK